MSRATVFKNFAKAAVVLGLLSSTACSPLTVREFVAAPFRADIVEVYGTNRTIFGTKPQNVELDLCVSQQNALLRTLARGLPNADRQDDYWKIFEDLREKTNGKGCQNSPRAASEMSSLSAKEKKSLHGDQTFPYGDRQSVKAKLRTRYGL